MAKSSNLMLLGLGAAALYFITRRNSSASLTTTAPSPLIPTVDITTAGLNTGISLLDGAIQTISSTPTTLIDSVALNFPQFQMLENIVADVTTSTSGTMSVTTEPNFTLLNGTDVTIDPNGTILTGTYIGMNVTDVIPTSTTIVESTSTPVTMPNLNLDPIMEMLRAVGYTFQNVDVTQGYITPQQGSGIYTPAISSLRSIFTDNSYTSLMDLPYGTIEANVRALFSTLGETSFTMYSPYQDKTATTSTYLKSAFQSTFGLEPSFFLNSYGYLG